MALFGAESHLQSHRPPCVLLSLLQPGLLSFSLSFLFVRSKNLKQVGRAPALSLMSYITKWEKEKKWDVNHFVFYATFIWMVNEKKKENKNAWPMPFGSSTRRSQHLYNRCAKAKRIQRLEPPSLNLGGNIRGMGNSCLIPKIYRNVKRWRTLLLVCRDFQSFLKE